MKSRLKSVAQWGRCAKYLKGFFVLFDKMTTEEEREDEVEVREDARQFRKKNLPIMSQQRLSTHLDSKTTLLCT